jgi:hypothetical protein
MFVRPETRSLVRLAAPVLEGRPDPAAVTCGGRFGPQLRSAIEDFEVPRPRGGRCGVPAASAS